MVRVDRQVDPKIRVEKQRRRQKTFPVLVLRRAVGHTLGLLLREDRIEALRERRIVKPHRIVEPARLQHVNRIAVERRQARHERRQIARHPQAQRIEADEKDVLVLKSAPHEGGNHRFDQRHGGRHTRARIGINFQPRLLLGPGNQLLARHFFKIGEQQFDLFFVVRLVKFRETRLPHRFDRRSLRRDSRGGRTQTGRSQEGHAEKRENRKAHSGVCRLRPDEVSPEAEKLRQSRPNLTAGGLG